MRENHIDQWDKVLVWVTVSSRDGEPFAATGNILLSLDRVLFAACAAACRREPCLQQRVGVAGAQTVLKRRRGISWDWKFYAS